MTAINVYVNGLYFISNHNLKTAKLEACNSIDMEYIFKTYIKSCHVELKLATMLKAGWANTADFLFGQLIWREGGI